MATLQLFTSQNPSKIPLPSRTLDVEKSTHPFLAKKAGGGLPHPFCNLTWRFGTGGLAHASTYVEGAKLWLLMHDVFPLLALIVIFVG